MPGYKIYLQKNGEVREGLKCSYCRLVLKDPIQTSETGRRYCKKCFTEAARNSTSGVDASETTWPDRAVRKEIEKLQVICENAENGCDWQGLFKSFLQDHLRTCQYAMVECKNAGCGERVFLNKIVYHLKNDCLSRVVKCKNCGKELIFRDLETHTDDCPNGLRKCKICQQEIPAVKLKHHIMNECTWIKCTCSSEGKVLRYEKSSREYHEHLQDITKLGYHLMPLLSQFSKISNAYQMVISRIDALEMKSSDLDKENKNLHQENVDLQHTIKDLRAKLEAKQAEHSEVAICRRAQQCTDH